MRVSHEHHRPAPIRYGSLAFPAKAKREIDTALTYLAADPNERALIERLEQSATPHHIVIDHHGNDSYDPSTRTIRWDPHSALMTTSGGSQSPALGLGHEFDHAVENSRAYDRLAVRLDPAFDNAEERRVILGSERHAALTLGESVRWDHDGMIYRVLSPTDR